MMAIQIKYEYLDLDKTFLILESTLCYFCFLPLLYNFVGGWLMVTKSFEISKTLTQLTAVKHSKHWDPKIKVNTKSWKKYEKIVLLKIATSANAKTM